MSARMLAEEYCELRGFKRKPTKEECIAAAKLLFENAYNENTASNMLYEYNSRMKETGKNWTMWWLIKEIKEGKFW